ncbi:hypothetical protein CBS101457_000105 [Exobasidium rhododendri]|nr:hypothetical protein CBS101457_000105 [Exobasidium rhododendri]
MASFMVGTFNTPELFQLYFDASTHTLSLVQVYAAHGNHSWLALNRSTGNLYATAWTEPACIASYQIKQAAAASCPGSPVALTFLNTAPTRARSGYVAVGIRPSDVLYTVGGPTGEVVRLVEGCGSFPSTSTTLQNLDFVRGHVHRPEEEEEKASHVDSSDAAVMDFGGLRHGSHSIDLSPDGSIAYVADIGRNCVWVYTVSPADGTLTLSQKLLSPRPDDGPRHVWPHPNGKVVYVLQEHSCFVDVFQVCLSPDAVPVEATEDVALQSKTVVLTFIQGVRIIPSHLSHSLFWADEVRLSPGASPTHLLASTRGLTPETKGYVALFVLDHEGRIAEQEREDDVERWTDLWQTPTSGGWANAVEPCYKMLTGPDGSESTYAALTDSERGLVMVLQVKEDKLECVAQLELGEVGGAVRGAATAVWI